MQAAALELNDLSSESQRTLDMYGVERDDPPIKVKRDGGPGQYPRFRHELPAGPPTRRAGRAVRQHLSRLVGPSRKRRWRAAVLHGHGRSAGGRADPGPQAARPAWTRRWSCGARSSAARRSSQGAAGRDHHPYAFSMFLAGGGIARRLHPRQTDEIGWAPVEDPLHVNDLHATMLHLFGLDHRRLTFKHQGLDQRLTTVTREARVEPRLIA